MTVEWIIFTIAAVAIVALWLTEPRAGGPGVE